MKELESVQAKALGMRANARRGAFVYIILSFPVMFLLLFTVVSNVFYETKGMAFVFIDKK